MSSTRKTDIAIIGMAGRFPKAASVDEFWRNLCGGVEGISFFSDEELAAAGVVVPQSSSYVKARGVLENADKFDAAFFGVNPKEAEVMDPQHRVFLECAWEALESAGCDPERFDGAIGVFAGMSMNTYLAENLRGHADLMASLNHHQIMLGNDKDFLPTRVSYKLNLRGPSMNIQTACSTSLVAVCVACQHLLNYQCDVALAGAVSISFPQKQGHVYQEGGIASPDGHCRTFDSKAAGTVAGEGVTIVVLKRLQEALDDGDQIFAVIKGFATNNDGANKIGYTAPSVEGQAEVIATAQAIADVEPETISYIEAHGTGTPLGDPIEIEGLTKAFRAGTDRKNFCAVGSVKSNVGHLDTAAGVAGLIKAALALHHKKIPPSLHFESPNPKIDFANSPFFVNAKLAEWKNGATPRRAGVSSFGIGGTNAHVVLEEAPVPRASSGSRPAQLLLLSAKTESALNQATANLAEHLKQNLELNLADAAYTLKAGRREFSHRRMLVCHDTADAISALDSRDPKRISTRGQQKENPPVAFMFPGQGAQHVNMALEAYRNEPTFRKEVDSCCEILKPHLGLDLRTILYPAAEKAEEAQRLLMQTRITQPALFVIEYALAKLWMSWGIQPEVMIGHSIGEYVAACLAGVFSLEDALKLVAARGRMMQEMPAGTMLAVRLPEKEVQPLLNKELSLSTVNAPALCVVGGPATAIEKLQAQLGQQGIASTPLHTSHAFHSAMMDPVLAPFTELVSNVNRNAPQIPFISNVTGTWITAAQATDAGYWAKHLRQTVRFADGIAELLNNQDRILFEVGPGQTLSGLAKQHPARNDKTVIASSLPRANETASDFEAVLNALGRLWLSGAKVDWRSFYAHEQRRRVSLPAYPFERKSYWVEPARAVNGAADSNGRSSTDLVIDTRALTPSLSPDQKGRIGTASENSTPTVQATSRKERIIAELRSIIANLSGMDLAGMSDTTTFTEMGFESLFLTQVSLAIEKKMNVRVAFRQLLEEANSIEGLVTYIDEQLPKENSREQHGAGVAPVISTNTSPNGSHGHAPRELASETKAPEASRNGGRRLDVSLDDEVEKLGAEERRLKQTITVTDVRSYPGLEEGLNKLCSAYVCDYLRSCGITVETGRRYERASLRKTLQLRPAYEKFLDYMLKVLAEDGIVRADDAGFEWLRSQKELPDSQALHTSLKERYPAFEGLLDMLKHCAAHYRQALAGDIPGVSVLLPNGRHDFLKERLQAYADQHKHVRFYSELAKNLILKLSRTTPLRILEVGGGGGELTWQLVPELAGRSCEYYFTDIGRTFVQQARKEAEKRGFDFMKFGVLDISRSLTEQGFEPNSFDIVLGLNVVHATPDLGETISHLSKVLVPCGLTCLVELTKYCRWDNMIIGLADGWWSFNDEFRKDSPLLGLNSWEGVFRKCGFGEVVALPSSSTERARGDAGLILAQWQPVVEKASRPVTHSNPEQQPVSDPQTQELPLTAGQREIWFASQMSPAASCAYNDSRLIRFRGVLRTEALVSALQRVVNRHEALRTIFSANGEVQRVADQLVVDVPLIDFTGIAESERLANLESLQAAEANEPFDLVRGPLLRAKLVRTAPEEHVLFLTIHHLVCDGHSWGIVLHDLAEFYAAESGETRAAMSNPLPLSEFVRSHSAVGNPAAEEFWLKQFQDGGPILELPTDRPRPSDWTFDGGRESEWIEPTLWSELQRVSAEHDCTLFITLLTAQYILLHRLTGQSDIAIGIPVADRNSKEAEVLVAHCINFLPVRLRITGETSFEDAVAEVKNTFLAAYENRACTLGTLIQKLNLPRDQSRMPLAPVAFNLDRLRGSVAFPGLETEVLPNRKALCSFDLNLNVTDANGRARLDCRYNANLFRPETIKRWLGHFETLLAGMVSNPRQRISELPLLSGAERQQILVEWNETHAKYSQEKCIHQLFEEQVRRTPNAPALVFGDRTLTYAEVNRRADQLVHRLQALGVGPETPVGICLERSDKMVIALLGVLKAGGAYVPLDPAYPAERIGLMLKSARAPLVLTQREFTISLESEFSDVKRAFIEDLLAPSSNGVSGKPVGSEVTSRNLAYVIHTSGSTGVAKPVAIEHRNAVNFISWAGRWFTREELAGVLFSTSICFDLSVFEVFATLCNGGKLIVAANAMELLELPAKDQVTLINTVPSAAASLLRAGAIPSSVRAVNLAGEPLKQDLVDKLYGLGTIQKVYDLYGPSETTTYSTCALRQEGGGETIGRPIANTQIYLLDAVHQPVPIGVPGEICIGGDGVARGYLHRPELTVEKFVPNPVVLPNSPASERSGGRDQVYKTGDLARWLPDGGLQFLGRADSQLKIRGFRVEPGEVQNVLLQHPAVRDAFVMGREEESGAGKQLVAYLVPKAKAGGVSVSPTNAIDAELRTFLESKLPHYMVPAHFVSLPQLPLSPNGKIDRRALPAPDCSRPGGGESFAAPQPGTEEALAAIWREVLNVNRVGANDNFFALGGHSLLVMQVISRARETFQVELPLRRFFGAPTIAALAQAIDGDGNTIRAGGPVLAPRASRSRAADLLSRVEQLSDEEVEKLLNDPELKTILP